MPRVGTPSDTASRTSSLTGPIHSRAAPGGRAPRGRGPAAQPFAGAAPPRGGVFVGPQGPPHAQHPAVPVERGDRLAGIGVADLEHAAGLLEPRAEQVRWVVDLGL